MIKIDKLNPFGKFCVSMGMIPSSYKESLTYEEQLLWFMRFLQDKVIPAVNNNADALEELQDYVSDYFDNLDVQDEINDKLDEMADNGTLAEIIEDYATIPELTTRVTNLERNAIYIGNSYAEGTGSTGGHTGLYALTNDMFTNAYNYTSSGCGFLTYQDHPITFESLLDNAIADSNFDNDTITDIIIIGAWGDSRTLASFGRTNFLTNISTAMNNFVTKVNNNFTNVLHIKYVWAESRNLHTHTNSGIVNKWNNIFDVHNIMKDYAPLCGIEYMGWIGFNTLMNAGYFSVDNIHPNDLGYKKLATLFKEAYNGNLTYSTYYQYFNTEDTIDTDSFIRGFIMLNPDHANLVINRVFIKAGTTPAVNSNFIIADGANVNYMIPQSYGYNVDLGYIGISTEPTFNHDNDLIAKISVSSDNVTNEPTIIATSRTQQTVAENIDNCPITQSNYIVPFYSR